MPWYRVSIPEIVATVNPLSGDMWKCGPIAVEEVQSAVRAGRISHDPWSTKINILAPELHRDFHIERIAALVDAEISKKVDPICIAISPDRVWVVDGNHRIAAAIVRGDPVLDLVISPDDHSIIIYHFPTAQLLDNP